jgi:hypothetical protein
MLHDIYVRTREGEEFIAFRWTRDPKSGCDRARAEGAEFGHDVVDAWAVEVK